MNNNFAWIKSSPLIPGATTVYYGKWWTAINWWCTINISICDLLCHLFCLVVLRSLHTFTWSYCKRLPDYTLLLKCTYSFHRLLSRQLNLTNQRSLQCISIEPTANRCLRKDTTDTSITIMWIIVAHHGTLQVIWLVVSL